MKTFKIIYIILFFAIIAFPLVGLIWYEEPEVTENKVLAEMPSIVNEDKLNVRYLSELADYFSDHFAYRQELVTANAIFKSKIFNESSEQLAIVGESGWLFLSVSLKDYQGIDTATDRGINNMAKTISLMQEYVESIGGEFVFACAPNKNTLYPKYMPYYYNVINDDNNLDKLTPVLYESGVNYADLKQMFEEQDSVLYHKGDSHWNNMGAAMVQDTILDIAGVEHTDFTVLDYKIVNDFEGDIDKILYPLDRHCEEEYDYSEYMSYSYVDESDVTANKIETVNSDKEKKLLCYRDSFGNSLLPFLADEFGYAYFSKSIPYRLDYMSSWDMDVCVIELVERNLSNLQKFAPIMPAPLRNVDTECVSVESDITTITKSDYDGYYKLSGRVDNQYVSDTSYIYLRLTSNDAVYTIEASPVDESDMSEVASDYGFVAYIHSAALPQGEYSVEIITENGEVYSQMTDMVIVF